MIILLTRFAAIAKMTNRQPKMKNFSSKKPSSKECSTLKIRVNSSRAHDTTPVKQKQQTPSIHYEKTLSNDHERKCVHSTTLLSSSTLLQAASPAPSAVELTTHTNTEYNFGRSKRKKHKDRHKNRKSNKKASQTVYSMLKMFRSDHDPTNSIFNSLSVSSHAILI